MPISAKGLLVMSFRLTAAVWSIAWPASLAATSNSTRRLTVSAVRCVTLPSRIERCLSQQPQAFRLPGKLAPSHWSSSVVDARRSSAKTTFAIRTEACQAERDKGLAAGGWRSGGAVDRSAGSRPRPTRTAAAGIPPHRRWPPRAIRDGRGALRGRTGRCMVAHEPERRTALH